MYIHTKPFFNLTSIFTINILHMHIDLIDWIDLLNDLQLQLQTPRIDYFPWQYIILK